LSRNIGNKLSLVAAQESAVFKGKESIVNYNIHMFIKLNLVYEDCD
jgi:hypothetical protein